MEGLAAVSLAGNILQFIHCSREILRTSREILASGAKAGYLDLEIIAEDLRSRADVIAVPQLTDGEVTSQARDSLEALSLQCKDVADELLAVLARLKLDQDKTKWTSFVQALQTQWHDSEIEALRDRLTAIGQAVDARLADNRTSGLQAQLNKLLENNRRLEISRMQDIVGLKEYFKQALENHQDKKKEKNEGLWADQVSKVASEGIHYSAEQAILSRLRFVRLEDRYSTISPAHHNTLTWLFGSHGDQAQHASSTTFAQWLQSDDNLYWVSGRPGSGKSTLMKFLCAHQSTKEQLKLWARDDDVVIAEYFFWNAGKNELQKSQEGLLRSLLYQILRQCPEQIRLVFPGTWRSYNGSHASRSDGTDVSLEPDMPSSIPGLMDALARTCDTLTRSHKRFCFFVDGLDEYSGDTNDIIQLVGVLRALEHVKICVSSRQWNEFEEAYGKSHTTKLLMEHFNDRDINVYIDDVFAHDENYQELEDRETRGKALVDEIVASANGVFLWVVLVVRSFQDGLREGDSIKRLQERLRHLPKNLEDYFERILFHDVKESYRDQAAQMFLVTLIAKENLPLMAYWFLDEDCPAERRPLTVQQTIRRHKDARKRLIAGCKGLLEPHLVASDNSLQLPSAILFEYRVDFLHRTVRDYLELPATDVRRWARPGFDPDEAICKAVFSQIKTSPQELDYGPHILGLYDIFSYHIGAVSGSSRMRELEEELEEIMVGYGVSTAAVISDEGIEKEADSSSEQSLEGRAVHTAKDPKSEKELPGKRASAVKNWVRKRVNKTFKTGLR
ncbi:uncharacterized protein EKO05_0006186 [Ascochyta rabiei]|uniref:Uncharacterized protein n=1 Tax=Didymella rabiei TaxID=5454 RepID=A0A163B056_DIDRA|nr:uncharacterized protein EKO05_0006186 [Ascochyta rabiei]KZM21496.1 hypothetical protein ST47_g7437 [Ascochyta rabiei]UPX15747.1 hypothetical protein EKO05_0006186 [Ascochyta rabiei]